MSFERLSEFRVERPLEPELVVANRRSDLHSRAGGNNFHEEDDAPSVSSRGGSAAAAVNDTVGVMVYVGGYMDGLDGRHYARRYPDLRVHFFEPSNYYFQNLVAHAPESSRYFFHNYGIGPETKTATLGLFEDAATTDESVYKDHVNTETVLIKSVAEAFADIQRIGLARKHIELFHINCEGCEYQVGGP